MTKLDVKREPRDINRYADTACISIPTPLDTGGIQWVGIRCIIVDKFDTSSVENKRKCYASSVRFCVYI